MVAGGFSLVCGGVMALFSTSIATLYLGSGSADDGAVVALAAEFLKLGAAFQLFDALQVTAAQALRGLKDTRMPMILAGASYWLVGAPTCVILGLVLNLKGLGVWLGFVICLAVAAALMCGRLMRLTRIPAV
jgi:MATE family multidrug resistance protein